GEVDAHLEVAYDEEDFGTLLLTEYKNGDATLKVNLRDLQEGFTTITSRPSGSGEVGGNVILDYRPDNFQLSTNLDVYRDRELENPSDPDNINIDWGTVLSKPLGEGLTVTNSFFASHTPQLISPRTSLRWNSTLSKSFRAFHDRYISTFVTGSAQMSRYDQNPSSEYDRYGIGTGIRFPLVDRLNFFVNYTQSFVEVKQSGEHSQPRVMDTGLSYTQNFGSRISGRASVTYRDEENTDGRFSFLSGADTIRGNIGFSYRPTPEVEIFLDGSLRNVLTEGPHQPAFNDADIRVGMRASWDSVFRWDPTATVRGTVYKDLNRNSRQDPGEPGVQGIVVRLGHQPVTTGPRGTYSGRVRAKMVKVGLDFGSIPQGYSLDSYLQQDIEVRQGETYVIDYG
ncbi:MAG: hypothetical protein K8I00_10375, partial [Candidatus Omnitrophica bacterium]|nr:hypothetical protein [Candidatus Omnitrophota bacterium]